MKKIFIFVLITFAVIGNSNAQSAKTIINNAISKMSAKNSYEYTFISKERFNGKYLTATLETKLAQSPKKIFLNNIGGPNKGKQLLYVKGSNNNKILINTFINMSLSPYNSLVRKGNHYIILDVGFARVTNILKDARKRSLAASSFDKVFVYKGDVTFNNKSCYKVEVYDPNFHYVDYKVKNGESTYAIAKRLNISEQLIIEKNNLSGFYEVADGMTIKIPSSYAKKSVLYFDKTNYHAIFQEIHDEKGVYEKYQFLGMKINPKFSDDEFTEDHEGYTF